MAGTVGRGRKSIGGKGLEYRQGGTEGGVEVEVRVGVRNMIYN